MRNRAEWKRLFLAAAEAALTVLLVSGALTAPRLRAQAAGQPPAMQTTATPQWQIDAGGKMSFDVTSGKPDMAEPGQNVNTNVPFRRDNVNSPTGGLFSATNFSLPSYILFAYGLTEPEMHVVQSQLPKWANTNRYDIEARAAGNPTRDQMRLMMQALLADRFKLALHRETHQVPVFALVLDKPGKLGPQLRRHLDSPPCPSVPAAPGPASPGPAKTVAGGFPEDCGRSTLLQPSAPGRIRTGARAYPLATFASGMNVGATGIDRPVLDRTGLIGTVDFVIEFTLPISGPQPPGSFQPDPTGPTFIEALKDQLGLKLESQTAPVDVLVIDHVEEPSPN
jgi:uncharacterized protein (TIGR03435 family)